MVYIIYSFTNVNEKALYYDMLYIEGDKDGKLNENGLRTYDNGWDYYPFKISDFKYVKQICINTDNVYIVRKKTDIVKEAIKKDGTIDFKVLETKLGKKYFGYILYDIDSTNDIPNYEPSIELTSLDKCIVSLKMIYKRVPKDKAKSRSWYAYEDCGKKNRLKCVNSHACHISNNLCTSYKPLQQLPFERLNTIMLPYKLYTLTDFQFAFMDVNNKNNVSFKPHGLWFAYGDDWIQYLKQSNFRMTTYNYLYEIELNMHKVYQINNLDTLQQFASKYVIPSKQKANFDGVNILTAINWGQFINDTKASGIVISPNFKKLYYKYLKNQHQMKDYFKLLEWYISWDVASGAIWYNDAIKATYLIYRRDEGELVPYRKNGHK
jgi:hypothetical protein